MYFFARENLKKRGWFESRFRKESIDVNGEPIPWYTYSFLNFLKDRLNGSMTVFEFGCGNSTIWFSSRVGEVIAVESDQKYLSKVSAELKGLDNVTLLGRTQDEGYHRAAKDTGRKFDIVVIDGIDRVNCVKHSLECLSEKGVIIFDNSDRVEYEEAYNLIKEAGFKSIDFTGMGAISYFEWQTTVYYRPDNCLNI